MQQHSEACRIYGCDEPIQFMHRTQSSHSCCEAQCSVVQVDKIDLYQLHGVDNATPIAEQMSALKALQDAGTIGYIGLNNMSTAAQLDAAWATGVRFHTLQVRYNMFARDIEDEVVPWCREHGVGILAHSVLGKGLLTGKYKPGHTFPKDDERADPSRAVRVSSFSWCFSSGTHHALGVTYCVVHFVTSRTLLASASNSIVWQPRSSLRWLVA
eukprot:SAG31_NODE_869_length_11344_cov_15.137839_3_plen_213_part_00